MNRWINFLFGLVAYAAGMCGLVLFMLFAGGWSISPWQLDGESHGTVGRALLINIGLVALFGLQHSIMARPAFKCLWTRIVPKSIERSCYGIATAIVVVLLCYFWQPLAGTVWNVEHPGLRAGLTGLQLIGWAIVVASSFMINHFELFGLQQTYYRLVDRPLPKPTFTVRYLYRFVRHPLQMGMLMGIWATPHMSASHMFLSAAMTAYITIGLYLEERDLATFLGRDYDEYRRHVPMIVPNPRGLSPDFLTRSLQSQEQALAVTPFSQAQEKP